jgi:methylphosphotriester-DNA--protein-cysteine methyltransferase
MAPSLRELLGAHIHWTPKHLAHQCRIDHAKNQVKPSQNSENHAQLEYGCYVREFELLP